MPPTITYEYLPKQQQFLENCKMFPFNFYIGGFGSGKTHVLVLQSLMEAQVSGTKGLIGAPTYKMLEDTTQQKFFDLCPPSWIRSFHRARNLIVLVNSARILFRSLENPGRLAGLDLDWFGLDEVGEVKEETFKMLQGRLRRTIGRRRGFGVGNPAGPAHWTYEFFVVKAKEYPDVFRLVQATSYENTFLPEGFTRDMEISFGTDTLYYRRYILGEFVAFEGAYWSNFDPRLYPTGHVLKIENVLTLLRGAIRWGRAVDFGFEHPFCCLWWVADDETIIFFDEYWQKHGLIRWHCLQMKEHEKNHQQWFGTHNYTQAWTDHEAVSRAEIAACTDEAGNNIGFDCVPTEKKVMESILLVQALFGQKTLFITENCKQALREIPSYHSKSGVVGEEPLREDDDTCACLRYATWMEMNHRLSWKRYADTEYTAPDDLHEMETARINY